MHKLITITINNKKIKCSPEETIFKIAKDNGIEIPGLCGHPDFPPKANCRVCVVEIKGRSKLVTSCSEKPEAGMIISTESERVKKSRNLNLELIFAEHIEKCPTCAINSSCRLLYYAEKYKINVRRFGERKTKRKTYKFANAVEIDGSQCIDCRNCVDACSILQKINYLEIAGKGINQEIVPSKDPETDCIYCGQCALHCPVNSAAEQTEWPEVEKLLQDKGDKTIVAMFAPSIRVSIGEEFGLPYGKVVTGQLTASLKRLGFDYVFDVIFGADITTVVEANELINRLKAKKQADINKSSIVNRQSSIPSLPMITSCCPGWVKYAEFYHPELLPNLTTARSPHVHLGGAIKTHWAEKSGLDPKKIVTVSIMPCTAKKFEAIRKELAIGGQRPVDHVLTTREFAFLLKKNNINLGKLKPESSDNPALAGKNSANAGAEQSDGAGSIYGASGGVMESALRTAASLICKDDKVCDNRIDFKEVRGMEGVKEAKVVIGGRELRIAVVNGIGHVGSVIKKLNNYDYIEVMACPGGCIGGGGQPIPTTPEIRKKRAEALYKIDKNARLRKAHENKGVMEILEWLKDKGKLESQVLHTKYIKRS
ncbi:MAG: [FeFe] hydrogenase, group A [Patescibacteria group bacterium]|jgi:iron-only hydrogenase group A